MEYGGAEAHERASVCDLLSCSSLEGMVKYLKLSEDQQEPVNTRALWAKQGVFIKTNHSTCDGTRVHLHCHVPESPVFSFWRAAALFTSEGMEK